MSEWSIGEVRKGLSKEERLGQQCHYDGGSVGRMNAYHFC